MKKIPTIFVRDMANRGKITEAWHPDCLWVRDGEGTATIKLDGTCCLVEQGRLYKRREIKAGQPEPAGFTHVGTDAETGKSVGWVPVIDAPEDRWHREAFAAVKPDGTYELIGPKIQGFKEREVIARLLPDIDLNQHHLIRHGIFPILDPLDRTAAGIRAYLSTPGAQIEGIVWHHPDGRMAKIKKRDWGITW